MEETRRVVVAGLKGYERPLSLSRDKMKPLHMAGKWNARNRRMAKLKSRDNSYKAQGKARTGWDKIFHFVGT